MSSAFVITAGPTREHLDPVRFLSNPSTGKMGFALARAAVRRGHRVTLVAGPVALKTPRGVKRVDVVSARQMLAAVRAALKADPRATLVATAAVADWRPAECAAAKLKKDGMSGVLKLKRNPDILRTVRAAHKVGFAAETGAVAGEARRKCRAKNLDFIVANDVTERGAGFGTDTNRVTLFFRDGTSVRLPLMSKLAVARRIVKCCENLEKPTERKRNE